MEVPSTFSGNRDFLFQWPELFRGILFCIIKAKIRLSATEENSGNGKTGTEISIPRYPTVSKRNVHNCPTTRIRPASIVSGLPRKRSAADTRTRICKDAPIREEQSMESNERSRNRVHLLPMRTPGASALSRGNLRRFPAGIPMWTCCPTLQGDPMAASTC